MSHKLELPFLHMMLNRLFYVKFGGRYVCNGVVSSDSRDFNLFFSSQAVYASWFQPDISVVQQNFLRFLHPAYMLYPESECLMLRDVALGQKITSDLCIFMSHHNIIGQMYAIYDGNKPGQCSDVN